MKKQIEEMAWDLCDIPMHPSIKSCEQCGNKRCHAMYYAKRAYNASYRKASDVAREIFAEMEKTIRGVLILIPFGYKDNLKTVECKKECYQDFLGYIAELKKKYESEDES